MSKMLKSQAVGLPEI